jgi:hypothetical protein
MTDLVLSSRQANGAAAHPAAATARPFSEVMEQCNAIASAGELIPVCYRGKPGAVLLAKMWADRHLDGDLFTTMQHIVPINGKPYVSAEMRVELASAKGYDILVLESDDSHCRLQVTDPKGRTSTVLAIMPDWDTPTRADIEVRPAAPDLRKDTWKDRASDMLYALGCRVADRRLVRSGAALLDAAQDYTTEPDPLDVLTSASPEVADELVVGDDEPTEAEMAADPPVPAMDDIAGIQSAREQHLLVAAELAGIKAPKVSVLKQGSEIARHAGLPNVATLAKLCHPDNDQVYQAVLDWIETQ